MHIDKRAEKVESDITDLRCQTQEQDSTSEANVLSCKFSFHV